MILQIIDKNPVKTVTNEKIKKEFWQDIQKYYMNSVQTFDLRTNPDKEQWGVDLIPCSTPAYYNSLAAERSWPTRQYLKEQKRH